MVSDKACFNVGDWYSYTFVPQKPGLKEKYLDPYLVPKFRKIKGIYSYSTIINKEKDPFMFLDPK